MAEHPDLAVGDVISATGPGVTKDLEKAYFKVVGIEYDEDGVVCRVRVSKPFLDFECTIPFYEANR